MNRVKSKNSNISEGGISKKSLNSNASQGELVPLSHTSRARGSPNKSDSVVFQPNQKSVEVMRTKI